MSYNYDLPRRDRVTQDQMYLLSWLSVVLAIGAIILVLWLR